MNTLRQRVWYRLQNKMRRVGLYYVRSQTDQRKRNTRNKARMKKQSLVRWVTQRDREGGKRTEEPSKIHHRVLIRTLILSCFPLSQFVPIHAIKAYGGNRCVAPRILNHISTKLSIYLPTASDIFTWGRIYKVVRQISNSGIRKLTYY